MAGLPNSPVPVAVGAGFPNNPVLPVVAGWLPNAPVDWGLPNAPVCGCEPPPPNTLLVEGCPNAKTQAMYY